MMLVWVGGIMLGFSFGYFVRVIIEEQRKCKELRKLKGESR